MSLGNNIQRGRKRKGISQEDMATQLNVSRQCVSLWETDQTVPSIDNMLSISQLLGLSVSVLLGQMSFPEDVQKNIEEEKEKKALEQKKKMEEERIKTYEKNGKIMSVIGFILGLISIGLFLIPVLNIFTTSAACVISIVSYKLKKSDIAIAGIVFGSVYFFASIIVLIVMFS